MVRVGILSSRNKYPYRKPYFAYCTYFSDCSESDSVLDMTKVLHFKIENTPIIKRGTLERESSKQSLVSFLQTNERFSLWHCLSRDSTSFSTDRSAGLVLNLQGSEVSEDTWGIRIMYIPYSTIKEKYVFKREFLYFKGFMDSFLHFDIGVK